MGREVVTVAPEPFIYGWWLRASFTAIDTEIAGVDVKELDQNLCKASSFAFSIFPDSAKYTERMPLQRLVNANDLSFSLVLHPEGDNRLAISVGVYEDCDGETGNYVLFSQFDKETHVIEKYPGVPVLFMLKKRSEEEFFLWNKFGFDNGSYYKWSSTSALFQKQNSGPYPAVTF